MKISFSLSKAFLHTKSDLGAPHMQLFVEHAHHYCGNVLTNILAGVAHLVGWLV
jgi:hypothetical protein